MSMTFLERQAARFLLKIKLSELHGESFETFFHRLMTYRHPDFLDVRTAGRLGDQGSDGLLLSERKLYASYAPEVFSVDKLEKKFTEDLTKARAKRADQFDVFVFVHNDLRGMHPSVATLLSNASRDHQPIRFEQIGYKHLLNEISRLERHEVEDVLDMQLPIQDLVFGVALEELEPLLQHLRENRKQPDFDAPIETVSKLKLDFNEFSDETKDELRRSMYLSSEIESYYQNRVDVTERDEVASAFQEEYRRIRLDTEDPDTTLWYLEQYVLGNGSPPPQQRRGTTAILAYFFQTCDIFENPPEGWQGATTTGELV
jgi:hypothetical protein